jgi:hypothetical protein
MKNAFRAKKTLGLAALVIAAALFSRALPAHAAGSTLVGVATTEIGQPLTAHDIEIVDFSGHKTDIILTKPGVYKADTTNLPKPLLIKGGNLFSYSVDGVGVANIDGFTDLVVNQIYESERYERRLTVRVTHAAGDYARSASGYFVAGQRFAAPTFFRLQAQDQLRLFRTKIRLQ